jgi:multiple sugar transport system substrate-binding protein
MTTTRPRQRTRHWALAAGGVALLTLAAACSSGSNSSGSSSSSAASSSSADSSSSAASSSSSEASSEASSASSSSGGASSGGTLPAAKLTVLFGSSGNAETNALTSAANAWAKQSGGSTVTVTPAQNLQQQLAQGFSSGNAPDVFYVGAGDLANYAKAGNLNAYADSLSNAGDFYPTLKTSFTYDGKFYCAPKDVSTLALFINTDLWSKAGLTDADIPTNWDQLETVAKKLTEGKTAGLSVSPERDRLDAFLVQNGGYLVDGDNKPTVNSQSNIDALTYVKKLYTDGSLKWPKDLGASWAGEAFGKGEAAMTIEGNWLLGSLQSDYPTIKYKVAELPAGPTGTKGTLSFTNCWGISATTKNLDQAKALVEYLTTPDQQIAFAKAFGPIPSVTTAKDAYLKQFPTNAPFVNGIDYAKGVVSAPGITDVLDDYNSQLQNLANTDPKQILDSVQQNLSDALGG